jgi:hypothetical protein
MDSREQHFRCFPTNKSLAVTSCWVSAERRFVVPPELGFVAAAPMFLTCDSPGGRRRG